MISLRGFFDSFYFNVQSNTKVTYFGKLRERPAVRHIINYEMLVILGLIVVIVEWGISPIR